MFKRYVTKVKGHQQKKLIISSFLTSTVTSGCLFEAHIYEATWSTNSTRHFIRSFFLKLSLNFWFMATPLGWFYEYLLRPSEAI